MTTTMTKRITITNVAHHIKYDEATEYDFDEETGGSTIQFIWDYENEKLDKIAQKEYRLRFGDKKKNLMWVEELKRIADWKQGEYIYAFTKSNADGYFSVHYKKNKVEFDWFDIIIEPSGFVCMSTTNNYTTHTDEDIKFSKIFIRPDSVYNDKISRKSNT